MAARAQLIALTHKGSCRFCGRQPNFSDAVVAGSRRFGGVGAGFELWFGIGFWFGFGFHGIGMGIGMSDVFRGVKCGVRGRCCRAAAVGAGFVSRFWAAALLRVRQVAVAARGRGQQAPG